VTDCGGCDCRKLHELLCDYLDEELKAAVCREIEGHLNECPDCRIHLDSVRKVIRLYREATPESLPVDIRIRLQDVLHRARERKEGGGRPPERPGT
jgi:RNA polymerase sigma-70 factor (ECF subfamily)